MKFFMKQNFEQVAFATGNSRPVPLLPTRFLVGVGSNRDEFERPLANIENIVEDTLPPFELGTTVAGPYMIRPRGVGPVRAIRVSVTKRKKKIM